MINITANSINKLSNMLGEGNANNNHTLWIQDGRKRRGTKRNDSEKTQKVEKIYHTIEQLKRTDRLKV